MNISALNAVLAVWVQIKHIRSYKSHIRPYKAIDLVYLDFQKAFDKVPHERLMGKVEAHGIRGNYSRWIRNWLTGRTQRVVIHDETSDPALVTSGVPQGSVLGPLLFIIYINDLDVGIISKINKFADDTKLCDRAITERDRATIQSDLNRLLQWTLTWQMSSNIEKCSMVMPLQAVQLVMPLQAVQLVMPLQAVQLVMPLQAVQLVMPLQAVQLVLVVSL
ncbi:Reverse transcriptase domain [Trinorchestia longiramus]|nr:Reverse transcriptase domain [Trinorchestia longiramus]